MISDSPSILIIEDDPLLCGNLALILRMEGFAVRTAATGIDGLAEVQKQRPDLILCDILMPEMDGRSLHRALRSDPELSDILFIFITALDDPSQIRAGMLAGADDYLPKPFSAEELVTAVTTRLNRLTELRRAAAGNRLSPQQREALERISPRERQVLMLVGQGGTTRDIAKQLFISPKTVEAHRTQLLKKLDAANAAVLARWATLAELLDEP